MSQSTHQSTDHKRQSQDKNQTHAYAKVWLYFMYYWMILGLVVILDNIFLCHGENHCL